MTRAEVEQTVEEVQADSPKAPVNKYWGFYLYRNNKSYN